VLASIEKLSLFPYMTIQPNFTLKFVKKLFKLNTYNDRQIIQRILALQYCINNSNCQWVMSIDDDYLINIENLEIMMLELNSNYNPFLQPVMKGFCINNLELKISYLQGGSGYIFSRKACEIIFSRYEEFAWNFNNHEDILTNKF
jgi:hypothetical protein